MAEDTDHDRLVKIETKLDIFLNDHEARIRAGEEKTRDLAKDVESIKTERQLSVQARAAIGLGILGWIPSLIGLIAQIAS